MVKLSSLSLPFLKKVKTLSLEKINYGVGHGLIKTRIDKVVIQVEVELQFDEEGTPLVYTLWEKLNKLIVFS